MRSFIGQFVREERGATAIEYALLAALIGVALVGNMTGMGADLNNSLSNTANAVP